MPVVMFFLLYGFSSHFSSSLPDARVTPKRFARNKRGR
jgi:hypothetical protein